MANEQTAMDNTLQITMVLVKCESGRYISFFKEFPNLVANGDTEDEVRENLIEILQSAIRYGVEASTKWYGFLKPVNSIEKTFNLTISEA